MGYKTPPTASRWKPGYCPNPRGRPKGSRNEAGMIADLLKRPVRVTSDGEAEEMSAVEALFRVWTIKAGNGDSKAAAVVNKIHEMAALETRFADNAPARIQLPRPFTPEQFDLLRAPAREKDRQKYLAMSEFYEDPRLWLAERSSTADVIPPAVKDGDRLAQQKELDKALAAYRSQLSICKGELTADSSNKIAQHNSRRAVARIGLLANTQLLAGEYASAFSAAEEATEAVATGLWIAPEFEYYQISNTTWINIVRALAMMFLPGGAEAQSYLVSFRTEKKWGYTSWEQVILRDLVQLRAAGHSHPMMDEIERTFYDAGWARDPTEDIDHWVDIAPIHAADIKAANLFANRGKLNEAIGEYRRILELCKMDLTADQGNRRIRAAINLLAWRIGRLAKKFILAGRFPEGLRCANQSLEYDPLSTSVNLSRAHALMFLGEGEQARSVYSGYQGKKFACRTYFHDVLTGDLRELRKANCPHKPVDEIERFLSEMVAVERDKRSATKEGGLFSNGARILPTEPPRIPVLYSPAPVLPLAERDNCTAAKELMDNGEFEQSIEVYRRCIKRCNGILASNHNMGLRDERREAADGIVEVAFRFILNNEDEKAVGACEYVLSEIPNLPIANIRIAHVRMLSGNRDDARSIYFKYRMMKVPPQSTYAEIILQDFKAMRIHKREDDLMLEIENQFISPAP
jgi:tetratricopeptide (TPR) repeat protein